MSVALRSIYRSALRKRLLFSVALLALTSALFAQQPAGTDTATFPLPDSPKPQQQEEHAPAGEITTALVGYVTNPSIVFPDIATTPGPLSTGRKFKLFVNQSISPPYIFTAAVSAAYSQARDVPKDYGQGWDAYGGRFGSGLARGASSSFFGTFLFASVLHQDPRFFPQTKPTLLGSVKYSAQRVFITRSDSGREMFNTSGLVGPFAAETLADAYLPQSEQTVGRTVTRYGLDLAWRFGGNMFRNYWPTLFKTMGLKDLKVIPDPNKP